MVNPRDVYRYLVGKGVSPDHAMGMLANIQGESGFNPAALNPNDGGQGSYGLYQHLGPRRDALEKAYGAAPTWQQQVDFALSEPEGQAYLAAPVADAAHATDRFVRGFERPANPDSDAAKRIGFLPTLAQQVGADVRQASAVSGMSTDTNAIPTGNPRTGMMDTGQGQHQGTPVQAGRLPPLPPLAYPGAEQPTEAPGLNPLISLLLGAAMGTGGLGSRLASGASLAGSAIASSQAAENDLYALKLKRSEAARKAAQSDALAKWGQQVKSVPGMEDIGTLMQIDPAAGTRLYVERQKQQQEAAQRELYAAMMEQQGRPEIAAQIRAGGNLGAIDTKGPAAPTYGVTPQYIVRDGQTFERRFASDGSTREVPIEGTLARQDPATLQAAAQGTAAGTTLGKAQATKQLELPETLATIDNNLSVVDALIAHPGRQWATGTTSVMPWNLAPGFSPRDYQLKLDQIKGAAFLQAFESLKGGGQITEAEGQKATQAISDLNLEQSEAEHEKSLNALKQIMVNARNRALKAGGRAPSQAPVEAAPVAPSAGWKIERE